MQNSNHSVIEDIFALVSAGLFVAFGVFLFQSQDLMVGGAAGIALLGTYAIDMDFGVLFFLINLPFYTLAWTRISKRFTLNTFISVTTVSILTEQIPAFVDISSINPIFAAILGGLLIGVGLLIMFRHKSSLGGLGILALYLQNKFNIRAGNFGLLVDAMILGSSMLIFNFDIVILSVIGAITLNLLIAVNHKPGRYQAYLEPKKPKNKDATLEAELLKITE